MASAVRKLQGEFAQSWVRGLSIRRVSVDEESGDVHEVRMSLGEFLTRDNPLRAITVLLSEVDSWRERTLE